MPKIGIYEGLSSGKISFKSLIPKITQFMATKIKWTNETWNPVTGCTKISVGCAKCYAEKMHNRLKAMGLSKYNHPFNEVRFHADELNRLFDSKKNKIIFVNSMSDTFHQAVENSALDRIHDIIRANPQNIFQILTKRIATAQQYYKEKDVIKNLWLGTSVECFEQSDRIDVLRKTNAALKFISFEPLLNDIGKVDLTGIDWIIIGAESGSGKRKCHLNWIRNLVIQANSFNIPVFVKQLNIDGKIIKNKSLFPDDLQMQEIPSVASHQI
jgi:protein gp37